MKQDQKFRQIAYVYLCIVPLIAFILAFALGHVSPSVYVPGWIVHSTLMVFAVWLLGGRYATRTNERSLRFALAAMVFVLPWVLATIFAGMGPPPFNIAGWAELSGEQQFRFGILVVCALSIAAAYSLLYKLANDNREELYSMLALTGILLAVPLFIGVMAFWGALFTDTAIIISKTNPPVSPEWLAPMRHTIDFITTIETCLFYFSTAMMALSMKKLNWLSVRACNIYFGISLFALAASLLPPSMPEPIVILNYVAGIPAVTMVMPYLMGLALLRHVDTLA
jgi:hypothetical protein